MAFKNIFISFESKKIFLGPKGIGLYTDDQNTTLKLGWENIPDSNGYIGLIPWIAIVEIVDTNEIWSHGKYIGGNISGSTINLGGNSIALPTVTNETKSSGTISGAAGVVLDLQWNEIPKAIYDSILNSNGTYLVLIEWNKVLYTGTIPYKELHLNTSYNIISLCPIINTDEEIPLTACGYIPEDNGRLYLKISAGSRTTEETISGEKFQMPTKPSLFVATSKADQDLGSLTFKFRKLI